MKAMLGTGCAELGEIGAKLRPTWSQVGAKWSQVGDPKGDNFLVYFFDRFGSFAHAGLRPSMGDFRPAKLRQVEAKLGPSFGKFEPS